MISYTDARMEQERNDPKWLVVNGVDPSPNVHWDLKIDYLSSSGVVSNRVAVPAYWGHVIKYRLHNGPGYKDGIAIDYRVDEQPVNIRDELLSRNDGWVIWYAGDTKPEFPISCRIYIYSDGIESETTFLASHFSWESTSAIIAYKIDEQKPTSTRDKLLSLLNDNESMEAIALEACLEQQKVIDKAKVIYQAEYETDVCDTNSRHEVMAMFEELYNLGMLVEKAND